MKTGTGMEPSVTTEEKVRKSLQELQPSATDKEVLVGGNRIKSSQQSKDVKSKRDVQKSKPKRIQKSKSTSKLLKKTTKDEAVQTEQIQREIDTDDLTSIDAPGTSERFWELLAERRRLALKNALEENKELVEKLNRSEERNKKLQEEKRVYKEMYDETVALVEVLQEMINEGRNTAINNSLEDTNNSFDDSVL
ncbi:uncharacterized protein LOC109858273 isoform X2 [Pseudomyrmex gracilis]|uniref:uncharacterized protein LOC109858273 isoform X2 n=1 Tax=Pseudomyrmex gracilis TaxID=219809 RepID=UPI0009959FC4|nr:uncharacterized protein LOC109858273 isoform X2 [Pseudomyrmex gracilis]